MAATGSSGAQPPVHQIVPFFQIFAAVPTLERMIQGLSVIAVQFRLTGNSGSAANGAQESLGRLTVSPGHQTTPGVTSVKAKKHHQQTRERQPTRRPHERLAFRGLSNELLATEASLKLLGNAQAEQEDAILPAEVPSLHLENPKTKRPDAWITRVSPRAPSQRT
ncbi:hypothetical protein [Microvirga vignae]|uniref:hypothetical protein n=1 Tax=Microvirga vignae TaxID=1225564 RepID=UPI001237962A|nr:hypothetical protein [Microvirga vignae]